MKTFQLQNSKLQNVVHVAKNGNDTTSDGSINNPFLTIQAAITWAKANFTINNDNHCQVIVSPGKYEESITDSADRIYIISENFNPSDSGKDAIIYNTGADAEHYPLSYGGRIHMAGISVHTDVGGVFGELTHSSYFQYCEFKEGHFIETTTSGRIYMDFRFCTFWRGGGFNLTGADDVGSRFIALRHCDIYGNGNMVFSSTGGSCTIKFADTMCHRPVLISGRWSLLCQYLEMYGTEGKFTFDQSDGDIFIYNSMFPNGMHFISDTTGAKTINSNTFRAGGVSIPEGTADITADVPITIVNYTNNEQYNGLCSNFQIAGPDRHVGGFAADRYMNLQCAVSSIADEGTIYLHQSYTDLPTITMVSGVDVAIDGDRTYSLGFTGDIVELGLDEKIRFHRLTDVAGGKIELNGDNSTLCFQSCHNVDANIVATSGTGSYIVAYNSTLYGNTGNPVVKVDNVDTSMLIGYSFLKGGVGQPAILFTVDSDDKFKAKFSTFIHGSVGANAPFIYNGADRVDIALYNCGLNASFNASKFSNKIGSANLTIDAQLTF